MFEALDLDAREWAEVKAYATLEPVGEAMTDYHAADKKRPPPLEPAKRRAMLRALLPPAEKKP